MRKSHLTYVPTGAVAAQQSRRTFDSLVNAGKSIEVTSLAGKFFPAGRVAIETSVFEDHVAWPNEAMRTHQIFLDESVRLQSLLQAAGTAKRHESPAEFSHRGLCATGAESQERRHALVLERFDDTVKTGWLIRQ